MGLFSSRPKYHRKPNMLPDQQASFERAIQNPLETNPLYQAGANYVQNLLQGGPGAFEQFEAPLMRQFNEQVIPGIAERFAGAGTGAGAMSSSALNQALARAAERLTESLGAQRANLTYGALNQGLQYAQQPYSNVYQQSQISPYQYIEEPGQQGFFPAVASAAGGAFAGPVGAAAGGLVGNWMDRKFGGGGYNQRYSPNQGIY